MQFTKVENSSRKKLMGFCFGPVYFEMPVKCPVGNARKTASIQESVLRSWFEIVLEIGL